MAGTQTFLCPKKYPPTVSKSYPWPRAFPLSLHCWVRGRAPYETKITTAQAACKWDSFTQKYVQLLWSPISVLHISQAHVWLHQNTLWHKVPDIGGWDRPGWDVRTHRLVPDPPSLMQSPTHKIPPFLLLFQVKKNKIKYNLNWCRIIILMTVYSTPW